MNGYVIGSDKTCDVVISNDGFVSSRHCHVWATPDGRVWVEDLGSMNGTYVYRSKGGRMVPEKAVGPTEITAQDQLVVGRTRIPARAESVPS